MTLFYWNFQEWDNYKTVIFYVVQHVLTTLILLTSYIQNSHKMK
jgi:hypothetical protein